MAFAGGGDQFVNEMVKGPELKSPEKGSLAGEYGEASWGAQDLSRGVFSMSLGLSFPEQRGSLVYPLDPKYSPSQGISEWGMGVSVLLALHRTRTVGHIDFTEADDLMSPWGQLVQGEDKDYYPQGFQSKVRVRFLSPNSIRAFLEDGTTLTFGGSAVVETPKGIYSWYLTEARNNRGGTNLFHLWS